MTRVSATTNSRGKHAGVAGDLPAGTPDRLHVSRRSAPSPLPQHSWSRPSPAPTARVPDVSLSRAPQQPARAQAEQLTDRTIKRSGKGQSVRSERRPSEMSTTP
ncbi:hypothetical protein NDU88_006540 [Pleurodeles waltl]|uniref:Uncharacterized protein n=1 Tax=Pleurodeles waltl TaxID=8319 RepID=A0AAV7SQ31_PLEWA|nr:hypothetical protein NDU88_006540 [Pleurodeles waltl]